MKTSLFRAIAGSLLGLALVASTSLLGQTSPFVGQDVGAPTHPGGITNNVDGTISINGGGDDIWNNADNFFYYYTSVTGLVWEAKMRVVSFTGPDYWSKIELMTRRPDPTVGTPQGPDPELNLTMTQTSQQNEVRVAWRGVRAGGSGDTGGTGINPVFPNQWVRITRTNSTFNFYYGTNGVNWTQITSQNTATTANGFDGVQWENPIEVGAAITAHNNGDANGATAVISNLTVTVYPLTPPTTGGVVTQIQSTATFQYTEASFSFAATNNANPNILNMSYAWYKNNQLVSTNPMGTQYTFLTTPADNGAQIYAVATVQAPYNSISVTSAVATLTVNPPSSIYTNGLKREFFSGAVRQDVEIGNVGRATSISLVSAAQLPGGFGDNYAERFSGYFVPPTTAAYVFFVAADDDTDVYLSTDSNPVNKALIAQEPGWSPTLSWLISGSLGAFDAPQKRSDQWSPDPVNAVPAPYPNGFFLTQGNLYYFEVVHHNGTGGDNFAVTYQTTNQIADPNWATLFTNGTPSVLNATNNNIALVTSPINTLNWTLQPTNLTVFEGQTANFFSKALSDSELALLYQWYTISPAAPIAGATSATLSIPLTPSSYNGLQGYCVARTAEGGLSITSSVATLTVLQAVTELGFAKDERWNGATSRAQVENGNAGAPTYITSVPAFEASINNDSGDNYVRRISGFFIPPATDTYVLFVNSDDDSDLFLSTDNTPANKRLVAQEVGWSNPFTWVGQGGGGTVSQKRSDQWSPDGGVTVPYAAGISLNAGQKYYIEAVEHEGGGGDNVEVTYKRLSESDPVNGADTRLKGALISISAQRCGYVAYTQQPTNFTAPPFGHATFIAVGTTDSTLPIGSTSGLEQTNNFIFYQWYKNSVAVPGANSSSYSVDPVQPGDNGSVISCQIRALGYSDNSLNPIWSNSLTATLTVSPQAVFEPGWAFVEWWDVSSATRIGVENNAVGPALHTYATPRFEAAVNGAGDNYANRVAGYFVPPTTGDYVFFLNSDDDSDLFLSTDSTTGNKRLVATEPGYANNAFGWSLTGGNGDTLAQRRSDQFTDPATGTQPYASGIHLLAGQKYYMEADHKEGGGGDYLAATYKLFSDGDPANGDDSKLFGNTIGFYAPRIPWVAFLSQPVGQTATSGGNSVTFTASGYSAPSIAAGTTGDPRGLFPLPATNVTYQWFRNGNPISGATASSYTLVPILPADGGAQFVCGIRAFGYADNSLNPIFSNSVPAVLTVVTDTVPPTIAYAATLANTNNPLAPLFIVDITFSEWMDASTLTNPANYSISGATITNIVLAANHRTVELDLNQMPTLPLNVTVNGVKDVSGNTIALNSQAPINPVGLTCTDVGTLGIDPAYPSFIWITGSSGYIVSAEGSDIWGNADGFNFTWELKTNDFDAVVRGVSITHSSQWAKMGLMVRETLDPNSRDWNIVNDPASADGIMAPDGSGFGANAVECNMRDTLSGASGGWNNLAGGIVPAYPNAWVRLKRTGNVLSAFSSANGANWTQMAGYDTGTNANGALPSVVYVGLCTTAHNNDALGGPPPPPFKFYNTVEYASYTSTYIPPAQLSVVRSGANIIISWAPNVGHLEASPAISGPSVNWQPVGLPSPATIPIAAGPRYFRVVNP